MKNLTFIIIALACIGLIVFGVLNRGQKSAGPADQIAVNQEVTAKSGLSSTTEPLSPVTQQATIKQEMTKYYPDGTPVAGASSVENPATTADQNFQITTSLTAKMYLVDKYKPGICFGAPSAPPQVAIDSMIASNQQLAKFLQQRYNLATDLDIYNKIKQLQGISLTETQSGKFDFKFMDGQCANVVYYEGYIQVTGSQAVETITTQNSHTYQ